MKFSQKIKNIIGSTIILSLLMLPIFSAQKAYANATTDGVTGLIGGNLGSASSYITDVIPTATQLPGCQKLIEKQIENLFGSALDTTNTLTEKLDSTTSAMQDVQVIMPDYINQYFADMKKNTDETRISTDEENTSKNCLDGIGKIVVKKMIQNITLSSVNWIKTGNAGNPFFVQNTSKYFEDIGKNEILSFAGEVNDPQKYPYAKAYMQSIADKAGGAGSSLLQSTGDAVSSLAPDISTPKTPFNTSFTNGGWSAWDNLIQNPANNPLGFQIEASNELASRIESAKQDAKDALTQANGYLSDQRCVDPQTGQPNGITKEQDLSGKKARATDSKSTAPVCLKWETVTPGKTIADFATQKIGYEDHALLDASTLNDAIAAILDAALGRFSSELTTNGLANMSTKQGDYNSQNHQNIHPTNTKSDFTPSQISTSTWLIQNPNFNIRTDLTQALIDEQRIYSDKLIEQDDELMSTVPKSPSNPNGNYGLIPTIYQLDYCIPGPHPGFEQDTEATLSSVEGGLAPATLDADGNISAGASIIGSAATVAGTIIGTIILPGVGSLVGGAIGSAVGNVANTISSQFSPDGGTEMQQYYVRLMEQLTGIKLHPDGNIGNLQQVNNGLNIMLSRYTGVIHEVFTNNPNMPTSTKEAAKEFNKTIGYSQILSGNLTEISEMKGVVTQLTKVKNDVDTLNASLNSGALTQDEYEAKLQSSINSFGFISSKMASGDDISKVDNITKQIKDEEKYIYGSLLKGPGGCEQEMQWGHGMPWQVLLTKRMTYPKPILYDYNNYASEQELPDPFNSGYKNKMTVVTNSIYHGPGFLSWMPFQNSGMTTACDGATDTLDAGGWPTCQGLHIGDLFNLRDWTTYVGKQTSDGSGGYCSQNISNGEPVCDGRFESIIGIY